MIDWFKIELMNRPAAALKKKLDYSANLNPKTGVEVGRYEESILRLHDKKGCEISVRYYPSGRVWVQGSIHKYWNGNNYSILSYCEMQKAFKYLFEILETPPEFAKILQIENGRNLNTIHSPNEYLSRLICFKSKPFERLGNYEVIGRICYQSEYAVKIYNKGKQYSIPDNILRVEKKITDSKHLKQFGISTISDLTAQSAKALSNDLLKCFDAVLFNDESIDESKLTTLQTIALAKYRNPLEWGKLSRNSRANAKVRYFAIIDKYGGETHQFELKKLLQNDAEFY